MAQELAKHHGLNEIQAAQAGLMHDLAKYFQPERLLRLARMHRVPIDPIDEANPHLLPRASECHRCSGRVWGDLTQKSVTAISNHTLGQPQMSLLSCAVFIADSLEPGRGDRPNLNHARDMSQQNLYHGVALVCDLTLKHLVKTQRMIHPRMVLTRNWAWLQTQA